MLNSSSKRVSNLTKLAFTDGVCEIYTVDNRRLKEKVGTFYFKDDTIGIKSYYGFQTLGVEIERVVSIPFNNLVNKSRVLKIGDDIYQISLIQVKDTFPKSLKLTLNKSPILWSKQNA